MDHLVMMISLVYYSFNYPIFEPPNNSVCSLTTIMMYPLVSVIIMLKLQITDG